MPPKVTRLMTGEDERDWALQRHWQLFKRQMEKSGFTKAERDAFGKRYQWADPNCKWMQQLISWRLAITQTKAYKKAKRDGNKAEMKRLVAKAYRKNGWMKKKAKPVIKWRGTTPYTSKYDIDPWKAIADFKVPTPPAPIPTYLQDKASEAMIRNKSKR